MSKETTVLTQKVLNEAICDTPGCSCNTETLVLMPRCHDAFLGAQYNKKTGIYTITCAECGELVTRILVAPDSIIN